MARIRTIKPSAFKNEELAALPFEHRLLFIGLWTIADREGRLEDRPRRIHVELFPYDGGLDMSAMLQDLATAGLIERYVLDTQGFIQIVTFAKHQRPHAKEPPSEIPPPESRGKVVSSRDQDVSSTLGREWSREGKGREGESAAPLHDATPTSSVPARTSPAVIAWYPTVGKGGGEWGLTADRVAEWTELYPGLDVRAECRQALAWLHANPGRRKTARGMPAFLVNWFNRAVNSGRFAPASDSRQPGPANTKGSRSAAAIDEALAAWERTDERRQAADREGAEVVGDGPSGGIEPRRIGGVSRRVG